MNFDIAKYFGKLLVEKEVSREKMIVSLVLRMSSKDSLEQRASTGSLLSYSL